VRVGVDELAGLATPADVDQFVAGGPYTLSGLAEANGLMVLGEKVMTAPAGSTVDVLLLDRRR